MGGRGSGRYPDYPKATVEQYQCLDIRALKRNGLLEQDELHNLSWSRAGRTTGFIFFCPDEWELVYVHAYRTHDDGWRHSSGRISFDRTPCNYGGERTWFSCPDCGERVGVLYAQGPHFSCRHCLNLIYESQKTDSLIRAVRRQQKALRKLGAETHYSGYPDKPKYMHWKTYVGLVRELIQSRKRCGAAFDEWRGRGGEG
jgi:hypothetical protein